jgi:hypothetical protein
MVQFLKKNYLTHILFLSLVLILGMAWLAGHNFISHSEFFSIASGKLLGSTQGEAIVVYYKSIFYLILKIPYGFNLTNIQHILFTRTLFGVIGAITLILYLWNLRLVTGNKSFLFNIFICVFLLSIEVYAYNIYRVRADLVSHLFFICALIRTNTLFLNKKMRHQLDPLMILCCSLIFLSTPKGIYMVLISFIYYLYLATDKWSPRKFLHYLIAYFLAPVGLTLFLAALVNHLNILATNPFALAGNYFWESLKSGHSWTHIITSLKINFLHYLLIVAGLGLFFYDKRWQTQKIYKAQVLLFFAALLVLIIHNEKWTYFIANYIPYLALPIYFIYSRLNHISQLTLALILVASPLAVTNYHSWYRSNDEQIQAIQRLEDVYKQVPNSSYFDSTGLLPRENGLLWFLGPNDPDSRRTTLQQLKQKKPTFIFFTSKLNIAQPEILVLLLKDYEEIQPDLWIAKDISKDIDPGSPFNFRLQSLFIYDFLPHLKY